MVDTQPPSYFWGAVIPTNWHGKAADFLTRPVRSYGVSRWTARDLCSHSSYPVNTIPVKMEFAAIGMTPGAQPGFYSYTS